MAAFETLLSSIDDNRIYSVDVDWTSLVDEVRRFLSSNPKEVNDSLAMAFEVRNDNEDAQLLLSRISNSLSGSTGFSFLRMGDGEGRYVGSLRASNYIRPFSDYLAQSVWFKYSSCQPGEDFYDLLEDAYVNSSILGYCPKFRLDVEINNLWYGYLGCVNGNKFIFDRCLSRNVSDNHNKLVRNWTNVNLLKIPEFKQLMRECRVGIISCHGNAEHFESFFPCLSLELTVIPPEGHPNLIDNSGGEEMYPDVFERVCEELNNPSCDIYLVGAGIYSKIFCERIRKQGKVGLDMGSTLDELLGIKTR